MIIFTPDEVELIAGYPRDKEGDMEVVVVLNLPPGVSPLQYPAVVHQSSFFSIASLASSVITVRIQKAVLQVAIYAPNATTLIPTLTHSLSPSPSVSPVSHPAEEEWEKQAVLIVLGLTTLQQVSPNLASPPMSPNTCTCSGRMTHTYRLCLERH